MSRTLPNTKAYMRLKVQAQDTFDLAVVTCHAIPALKLQISLVEKGTLASLPRPDYYPQGNTSIVQLKKQMIDYKSKIARFTFLSSFSFFEAFVSDAIKEMIDYHGGLMHFQSQNSSTIAMNSEEINKAKQKLRSKMDNSKIQRYKKFSAYLQSEGYRFPSSLLSGIGVSLLLEKLNNMKAVDIPSLLRDGLLVPLDDSEIEEYHNLRAIRNSIAHGEQISFSLKKAGEMNDVLRKIAYKLDKHLNEHYMVNENFI
jgi:hypothetical protein